MRPAVPACRRCTCTEGKPSFTSPVSSHARARPARRTRRRRSVRTQHPTPKFSQLLLGKLFVAGRRFKRSLRNLDSDLAWHRSWTFVRMFGCIGANGPEAGTAMPPPPSISRHDPEFVHQDQVDAAVAGDQLGTGCRSSVRPGQGHCCVVRGGQPEVRACRGSCSDAGREFGERDTDSITRRLGSTSPSPDYAFGRWLGQGWLIRLRHRCGPSARRQRVRVTGGR